MAEFPALPIFTDAYLADTLDLKTDEHGAYLLMLMIAWRRPNCSLPGDINAIKRLLAGASSDMHGNRANRIIPMLLDRFFERGNDGDFHQKRLGKERDFLRKRSEKQTENAKKRWQQFNKNNQVVDATVMPHGNAPTPTPTPIEKKDNKLSQKNRTTGTRLDPSWKPSPEAIEFAHKEGHDNEAINRMSAEFVDYWTAKTGQQATKLDWDATWRNWVRRSNSTKRTTSGDGMAGSGERVGPLTAAMRKFAAEAKDENDFPW